jgi:hypothetical protein
LELVSVCRTNSVPHSTFVVADRRGMRVAGNSWTSITSISTPLARASFATRSGAAAPLVSTTSGRSSAAATSAAVPR